MALVKEALLDHLLELAVLGSGVGDDLVVVGLIHGADFGDIWDIDGDRIGLEVLRSHLVEWQSRDVGISLLLTLSKISDKSGDVLFELSKIHSDVVLIENGVIIVLLVACNRKLEAAVVELADH